MEKEAQQSKGGISHRRVFKDVKRSVGGEGEELKEDPKTEASDIEIKVKQECEIGTLEPYVQIVAKNTELFSIYSADTLIDALRAFCSEKGLKFDIQKDKYKVKMHFPSEDIDMTCKILSFNEDTNCIEINRNKGSCMQFYDQFNLLREFLGDLVMNQSE